MNKENNSPEETNHSNQEKINNSDKKKLAGLNDGIDVDILDEEVPGFWHQIAMYGLMSILLSCGTFAYNALRILKDVFINKYTGSNIALFFIKTACVTPLVLLFPFAFSALCKAVPSQRVRFYYLLGFFFGFYTFCVLMLPYCEQVQGSYFITKFQNMGLGTLGMGIGTIPDYWFFCLFYSFTELLGMVYISILGWGTINDLMPKNVSKKAVYPYFTAISNIFTVIGSLWVSNISSYAKGPDFLYRGRYLVACLSLGSFIVTCITHMLLMHLGKKQINSIEKEREEKPKKIKVDSPYWMIWSDPYLFRIAIMVAAYNFCTISVESFAKPAVLEIVGTEGWSRYQGLAYALNASVSIFISIISARYLQNINVSIGALMPAFMMGGTGLLFLCYYIMGGYMPHVKALLATCLMVSPQFVLPLLAIIQLIASKSSKYTMFDASKEIFFSEGDEDTRYTGKAAIDTAVNRGSKSFGAVLMTLFITLVSFFNMSLREKALFGFYLTPFVILSSIVYICFNHDAKNWAKQNISTVGASFAFMIVAMLAMRNIASRRTTTHQPSELHHIQRQSGTIIDSSQSVQGSHHKADSSKKESQESKDLKRIAPIMLIIFILVVLAWIWSVITIFPMYQERRGEQVTGVANSDITFIGICTALILATTIVLVSDPLDCKGVIKTRVPYYLRPSTFMPKWLLRVLSKFDEKPMKNLKLNPGSQLQFKPVSPLGKK